VPLKKWVCVLGRSFHVHISVHSSNKPINAIKNTNFCTYSLAKEDDDNNLIRNRPYGTSKYYYQDENVWNIINLSAHFTLQNTRT
jgi:hypothetical protein